LDNLETFTFSQSEKTIPGGKQRKFLTDEMKQPQPCRMTGGAATPMAQKLLIQQEDTKGDHIIKAYLLQLQELPHKH
jgi:hypothetical protein